VEAYGQTRVVLRPIATPFPLGFLGLAAASTVFSASELGFVPSADRIETGILILAIAPVPQLVASLLGFSARDAVAGTGLGTLAWTWAAIGLTLLTAPRSPALGMALFVSSPALLLSSWIAGRQKVTPALVMLAGSIRFLLTGIYEVSGVDALKTASGVAGLVLAGLAVTAAAALEVEDSLGRPFAPTLRRGEGRRALQDGLGAQVAGTAHEAGVRRTL
jgi:succinate-acetate transporter protein